MNDTELYTYCSDILNKCARPSYYDVSLLCNVLSGSAIGPGSTANLSTKVSRFIPTPKLHFFHSVAYHSEGTCLAFDLLYGFLTTSEQERLRSGDLRMSYDLYEYDEEGEIHDESSYLHIASDGSIERISMTSKDQPK